jgi:hypothetical protein
MYSSKRGSNVVNTHPTSKKHPNSPTTAGKHCGSLYHAFSSASKKQPPKKKRSLGEKDTYYQHPASHTAPQGPSAACADTSFADYPTVRQMSLHGCPPVSKCPTRRHCLVAPGHQGCGAQLLRIATRLEPRSVPLDIPYAKKKGGGSL